MAGLPIQLESAPRSRSVSGKSVDDAVAWYVRQQIVAWLAQPGHRATDLAKGIGVTKAQVSVIQSGDRGIGHKTAVGMAEFLGVPWEEFKRQAAEAYRSRPQARELRVVPDERYPNRARAIEFMRGQVDEEAIRRVQVMALLSDADLTPKEWADLIAEEHRRIRIQAVDPARAAEERSRNEALADEMEAEAHARGAAALARRARKFAGVSTGETRVVPVAPEGGLVGDPATGEWVEPSELDEDAPAPGQKGKTKR